MNRRDKKHLSSRHRTIMAIEIEEEVAQRFEAICSDLGISHITVTSRLMRWFAAQPIELQSRILGMHGDIESQKTASIILRRVVEGLA